MKDRPEVYVLQLPACKECARVRAESREPHGDSHHRVRWPLATLSWPTFKERFLML